MLGLLEQKCQRKKKLKPVDECMFNGKHFKRVLDIYAEEPPEVPETEQWGTTSQHQLIGVRGRGAKVLVANTKTYSVLFMGVGEF